eukprot:7305973-Prymnesium_polylepis.1
MIAELSAAQRGSLSHQPRPISINALPHPTAARPNPFQLALLACCPDALDNLLEVESKSVAPVDRSNLDDRSASPGLAESEDERVPPPPVNHM